MEVVAKEKYRVLAELNGWSLDHAKGYVEGEAYRLRGMLPSQHILIGIDEYSLGFRAGFYERRISHSAAAISRLQGR